MKKIKIAYLLLGIGIGIILINNLYSFYPQVKYKELSEEMIIEKAEELGYVSLKERIIREEATNKIEPNVEAEEIEEEKIEDEYFEEDKSKEIVIQEGDSLSDVANKLYEAELIDNIEEFKDMVKDRDLEKKLLIGVYNIKYNTIYEDIIELLTN